MTDYKKINKELDDVEEKLFQDLLKELYENLGINDI